MTDVCLPDRAGCIAAGRSSRINPLNNSIKVDRPTSALPTQSSSSSHIDVSPPSVRSSVRLLAAFNNFNSSFYETCRSRVGIAAPVASVLLLLLLLLLMMMMIGY